MMEAGIRKPVEFPDLSHAETEEVLRWRNHESVRVWQYSFELIALAEHLAFVEKLRVTNQLKYWKVGEIGVIYLTQISHVHRRAYLGIYANPFNEIKRKGQALMENLLRIGFDEMKLNTIKLEVHSDNSRAVALYERFGFKIEGLLREYVRQGEVWKDIKIMGITAAEYANQLPAS